MARRRRWWWRRRTKNYSTTLKTPSYKPNKIKKILTYSLAGVITFSGWYALESQVLRQSMTSYGVPKFQKDLPDLDIDWFEKATQRVYRNEAFMVGYSEKLGNPLWVTYKVLPKPEDAASLKRPTYFKSDWRSTRCLIVIACVEHEDFTGTGYDRGHLAPNHLIATRYGKKAQEETFLLTNITPQKPNLNRKAWQRLEEISANHFAENFAPFTVITGPIFGKKPSFLPGYKFIAIPKAFYKIFIKETEKGQAPKVLAFILPQNVKGNEDLSKFLVSVREIEEKTGLNFMHQLDKGVETYVETLIDPQAWKFTPEIANKKARY